MKQSSLCLAVLFVVGLSFAIVLDPVVSRGQRKDGGKPGADAATRNAVLSTSLTWTFGSKQQQGWYLYTPLIKQLIGTRQESATVQFAQAVARWQAKSALKPSGVYAIVDNSAQAGSGTRDTNTLHRIDEDFVVQQVEKDGFRLVATSDVLRNPNDPRTEPFWKINHTQDRFILKFVKP